MANREGPVAIFPTDSRYALNGYPALRGGPVTAGKGTMTPPIESPKVTRKARQLRVPVLPTEESDIKSRAAEAGLTVAAYLRNIALGYEIRGVVDHQKVDELLRINADLGRLGGLLKLWLTDDPRTVQFGEATIRALLGRIEATQDVMRGAIDGVLRPRSVSK